MPNLIILDVQLPDISGLERSRLKADEQRAPIPIIALPAFALQGDEAQGDRERVDAYVSKPLMSAICRDGCALHGWRGRPHPRPAHRS